MIPHVVQTAVRMLTPAGGRVRTAGGLYEAQTSLHSATGIRRAVAFCHYSLIFGRSAILLLCVVLSGCGDAVPEDPASVVEQAHAALKNGQWEDAVTAAEQVPTDSAYRDDAQFIAGEAATRAGRFEVALDCYLEIADRSTKPQNIALAIFSAAEVLRELGQLSEAEAAYRRVLARSPDNAATHERLAFLLSTTGRRWEALPHYFFLVQSGSATIQELCLFADLDRAVERRDYLQECFRKAPGDAGVLTGLAAHDFWEGRTQQAQEALQAIVDRSPENLAAQAFQGELLVDQSDAAFVTWHRALPAAALQHPDIWFVRGLWARRHGESQTAAHAFWQCLRMTPTHRRAAYQLGQTLAALDDIRSSEISELAVSLMELTRSLDDVLRSDGGHEEAVRVTAERLEALGRIWEACAWSVIARQQFPNADWPHELLLRQSHLLPDNPPIVLETANLATRMDLSEWDHFEGLINRVIRQLPDQIDTTHSTRLSFAEHPGLREFLYTNGADPQTPGARMFEQTGGGVAVIDIDGDTLPDLFFPQGAEWPTGSSEPVVTPASRDSLFRNGVDGEFVNITSEALPADPGFGQGCTVADFDNDGFPDLYVANVGRNQLLRNQGDGTFVDVTTDAGLTRTDWTTSVVVIDLNADGLPDLFDVNYLQGRDVYQAICNSHACSPSVFNGTPDQLFINQGNGLFEAVPDATPSHESKGLGVAAVILDDPRRPALLIANDQVANFFLRSIPSANGHGVELRNDALLTGLAYNDDGLAMACMGIAADDVNGDSLTDLFVTNFKDESNTLYLQDRFGLFADATNRSGLKAPSLPFVSWGTQFLDADLDGRSDLAVVSGHVDDYRDEGGEYQMRPQFFHQTRPMEFEEHPAGDFFTQKILGRGLARLDWNQDGRMDLVVSRINEAASLLTNNTDTDGHYFNIRLHATTTARDAIGARVTVSTTDGSVTRYLLAGDGYMASNERLLQFGLGTATQIESVTVHWPGGGVSHIEAPPLDATLDVVEGTLRGTLWVNSSPASVAVRVEDPQP